MNKKELIYTISEKLNCTFKEVSEIVEKTFELITSEMAKGKPVRIVGFGEFSSKRRRGRIGINPKTRQPLKLKATKTPGFSPGKDLKDRVKGKKKIAEIDLRRKK